MRLLLISDTHGNLEIIKEKAAWVRADAVSNVGNFGFLNTDSAYPHCTWPVK
jgi:predicted phosphodiesterase